MSEQSISALKNIVAVNQHFFEHNSDEKQPRQLSHADYFAAMFPVVEQARIALTADQSETIKKLTKRAQDAESQVAREVAAKFWAKETIKVLVEALELVKNEQVQSDMNDLENKTINSGLPVDVNLSLPTRIACDEALALAKKEKVE